MDVPLNVTLNWTGGDPDPCDIVTYDVYFDDNYPPVKRVANQTHPSYEPPVLRNCTKYYWQIISWDNHGLCTEGSIWCFTTYCPNTPPGPPEIDGPTSGKPDESYIFEFTSSDDQNHSVYYEIIWGDGTSEDWIGPFPSGETIAVNHSWSKKRTYIIQARAKDEFHAIGNWSTYEVAIPKNKAFIVNFPLLSWLFERFPNAFPILRYFLEH